MGYLLTILVEYGNTVTSQIDVASVVNRHAVRPHVGKHLTVRQRAVRLDVISQDPVGLGFCYIQIFSVRRSYDAIGLVKR